MKLNKRVLAIVMTVTLLIVQTTKATDPTWTECEAACDLSLDGEMATANAAYFDLVFKCDQDYIRLSEEVESDDVGAQIAIMHALGECMLSADSFMDNATSVANAHHDSCVSNCGL